MHWQQNIVMPLAVVVTANLIEAVPAQSATSMIELAKTQTIQFNGKYINIPSKNYPMEVNPMNDQFTTHEQAMPEEHANAPKSAQEPIAISGFGGNSIHDCGSGRNVVIDAANVTVTLTGICKQVEVTGMGNTVTLDTAEKIVVEGTMNKISYRRGVGNRPPTISNIGFNNQIRQVP